MDLTLAAVLAGRRRAFLSALDRHRGGDPEGLHDMRVAGRRTRVALRALRGGVCGVHRSGVDTLVERLRWLQRSTGDLRDLDVLWAARDDIGLPEAVGELLAERRRRLRARADRELSRGLSDVDRLWADLVHRFAADAADTVPGAGARPVGPLLSRRIDRVARRLRSDARGLLGTGPGASGRAMGDPTGLHELRKQGKRLRYLLELAGPVAGSGRTGPVVTVLKDLQDALGRHQDHLVAGETLAGLAEEGLAGGRLGAADVVAIGRAIARLEEERCRSVTAAAGVVDRLDAAARDLERIHRRLRSR